MMTMMFVDDDNNNNNNNNDNDGSEDDYDNDDIEFRVVQNRFADQLISVMITATTIIY